MPVCVRLSLLALYPALCLLLPGCTCWGNRYPRHPTPVGSPQQTCYTAVLRQCSLTRPFCGRTGSQPGPLCIDFFLHEIFLWSSLLKFNGGAQGIYIVWTYSYIRSYITYNTYVTSHMEKRPAIGSIHPCAMSWDQAAHSLVGLGGWPLLDWGLCSLGVSWWWWGSMFPVDHRVRPILFLASVGHSAG